MSNKKVSKFIEMLMAFAIFWMVIGDLITYHQQVIFGINYFDNHNPFTKPKSKDDGKTSSFNPYKTADKSGDGNAVHHLAGLLHENRFKHLLSITRTLSFNLITLESLIKIGIAGILRAPPSFY